jgi:hypothetical protein
VCAIPIRAYNQLLVVFEDGIILTMTMGADDRPQFTWRKYYLGMEALSETNKYVIPIAWSSQADDAGRDRIHVSHYSDNSEVDTNLAKYVLELNHGWGFAGVGIPAYFDMAWNYAEAPLQEKVLRKCLLEGLSKGQATLWVQTAKNFEKTWSEVAVALDLPRSPTTLYSDFEPYSNINSLAQRGRNISLRVSNDVWKNGTLDEPEPSAICQVLILGFTPDGIIVK